MQSDWRFGRKARHSHLAAFGAMRGAISSVLFDFAGTLFTPRPAGDWVAAAASDCGITLGPADVTRLAADYQRVGLPGGPYPSGVSRHLERAYARRDLSTALHRQAYVGLLSTVAAPSADLAEAVYAQVLRPEGWTPYGDTHRVVSALAEQGIQVGVVSNVGFDLRPILRYHGLGALTETCVLSYEQGVTKPDPAIFQAALHICGTSLR